MTRRMLWAGPGLPRVVAAAKVHAVGQVRPERKHYVA